MGIEFRKETFRDDFTFRNSPAGIRRFPFPFDRDDYMYAVNIEPHVKGRAGTAFENLIDVDEHYVAEMQDRALVLKEDPLRCQSLPHMTLAGWDLLELLMEQQAEGYPEHFELHRDGNRWRWINRPLGIDDTFTFGDEVDPALRADGIHHPPERRAISACSTSATAICGWMPASSPPRPTGRSISTSA